MKNNILYFLLGVMLVVTISATSDKKETKKSFSNGSYIANGDGYKLYKHRDGSNVIYVAKSKNSYPVSVSVNYP